MASLREFRQELSKTTAEGFAEAGVAFGQQLESEKLGLYSGLTVATEWIEELRRLKRAMGMMWALPGPEGPFPTPSQPIPTPHPDGRHGSPMAEGSVGGQPRGADEPSGPRPKQLPDPNILMLTNEQVADLVGVSPRKIRAMASSHAFPPPIKVDRLTRWRRSDVEAWVAGLGR